jgi:hypothetical protein
MTNEPHPKRAVRWFRINLRTFLLLITVALILMGRLANQAIRQQQAVAWVIKNGGSVDYAYEYDSLDFWVLASAPPRPHWLRKIVGLDYFSKVVQVDLAKTDVSDVKMLSRLHELKWLYVYDTPINDISPLQDLTKLETLYLHNTSVENIQSIENLTNLTKLDLYNLHVSDIRPLVGLTNLKELYLYDTNFEPQDVKKLKRLLPNCTIGFRPRGTAGEE